jgi:hypothetical protein
MDVVRRISIPEGQRCALRTEVPSGTGPETGPEIGENAKGAKTSARWVFEVRKLYLIE